MVVVSLQRKRWGALVVACLLVCLFFQSTPAQGSTDSGESDALPKVPASLVREVGPYTRMSAFGLAGWHPSKRELWAKAITPSSSAISGVTEPGDSPQPHTLIPSNVYDVYYSPQETSLVYVKDTDGNEVFQLYAFDPGRNKSTLISDGKSRNTEPVWSNKGDRVIYSSNRRNRTDIDLYVVSPSDPTSTRLLAEADGGGYLKVFDWSPDDRQALFYNWLSTNESYLYVVDVASGKKTLLTPKDGTDKVSYDFAQFSGDGKGIYLTTDRDSEFLRLAYMDFATRKVTYLSDNIKWNIEIFSISPDRKTLAFVSNEDGVSRLHFLDTSTNKFRDLSWPAMGVISNLRWHNNSTDLAFVFSSPRSVWDIYSVDASTNKVTRWLRGSSNGIDVDKFAEPELIHWKSFDSREISGLLYRPPPKFTGKRPVIVDIHGGPDNQARPEFNGPDNYFVTELGIAKIYPNVRGSTGYGKSFLRLDDGYKREDTVRDIGALLDWIKAQPNLDADRVMITGESYGGFIALSVAANYSDRIRAAQSLSGPSNIATLLEHTEDWLRDRWREEYGDERDPKMRAYLDRIAPLTNAEKIKKPLMIVQGENDARVRTTEADQIVKAVRKTGAPVWYLLAKNEGHDFTQNTLNLQLYETVMFVNQFLLK
jgi:dipeptidyl aminopeptidase/acylaminoacyl peptidase